MSDAASTWSTQALGTTAVLVTTGSEALARGRELLLQELADIDLACSRFRPDSELARANQRAGETVHVSELFAGALDVALRAAATTGGLVDPTLGANLRSAGYDRTFALVRARDGWTFRPLETHGRWESIELDLAQRTLCAPRGVELDLGATAKAWAADRAASAIAADTGCGVLVSLGGDIATGGTPPAEGWSVLIADDHASPLDAAGPLVSLAGGGLATSGTAVRRWRTTQGDAHHILDPRTGRPAATPWRTVTVAAQSCVDANVAATAAVVLGDGAVAWLAARALPARLVGADGSVVHTGGWPAESEARAA